MALPKTEPFTASNQLLATYDANWVANGGVFQIISNVCAGNTSGGPGLMQHWAGDTFSNTHYAKATVTTLSGNVSRAIGVATRCNTSSNNGYYWFAANTESYVGANQTGTYNDIGSNRGVIAANDILELRASATGKLQIFKNSVQVGTDISDATFSGGYAGISGYSADSTARLDNWEGGDLGGSVSSLFVIPREIPAGLSRGMGRGFIRRLY